MGEGVILAWWSLVPPILAIGLALWTRQVYLSLGLGILSGYLILAGGHPWEGLRATIDATVNVFQSGYNTRIILFTLIVGALIALVQANGGVEGFIARVMAWLERKSDQAHARGQRIRVEVLALLTGLILFIESNISILTVGTLYRPIFDRLGIPREKLAYIADSSSAPSSVLFPFNAWGAYVAGLLALQGVEGGFGIVLGAVVFNAYPMLVVVGLLIIIFTGRDIGPMKRAEARGTLLRDGAVPMMDESISQLSGKADTPKRARNMLIPIGSMIVLMGGFLWMTGTENLISESADGSWSLLERIEAANGAKSVLYAVTGAVIIAMILSKVQGLLGVRESMDVALKGMAGMVPLAILMVLAFALGTLCQTMGTGQFVADLAEPFLSPALLPALVFIVSAMMAFATGTSWGTYAIMIAIAVPLSQGVGGSLPLAVAAVMGGGVFGDHSSPISDTSIISSMASASDHIDHVRTQLPYALIAGAVTVLIYLVLGVLVV